MRARVLRAAAIAAGVGACGLAISSPAFAVVATTPTPTWQTNGRVNVIVVNKNRVYIGGQFTAVRPPGAPAGSQEVTRNHVAAFNATTGAMLAWNPNASAAVSSLAGSGSTVYIGGSFSKLGSSTRSRIGAVNATTGAVLSAFKAKLDALKGAVAGRFMNVLVTDEDAAQALLRS